MRLCSDRVLKKSTENPVAKSELPWNWAGVEVLNVKNEDAHLRQLVAMFPSKSSSDEEIAAYLIGLRARFQRWLHQNEFGPDRRQRTATLRALIESIQRLDKHLNRGGHRGLRGRWMRNCEARIIH